MAWDDQNLEYVCGPLTRFLTILWKLGELLVKGNWVVDVLFQEVMLLRT